MCFRKCFQSVVALCFSQLFVFASFAAEPRVITWDDLIPTDDKATIVDYSEIQTTINVPTLEDFDGDQEYLDEYISYMNEMRSMQAGDGDTLAVELDKKKVQIAGYATPINFEGENIVEFLFVPYLGACMHVPPPPSNQIIYVENAEGLTTQNLYDPVYIVGELSATPVSTMVANVGYTIQQAQVLPYDEPRVEARRLIEVFE